MARFRDDTRASAWLWPQPAINALKSAKTDFKRDLKLEALVEILDKKRFISCHSYVQSEINMLI